MNAEKKQQLLDTLKLISKEIEETPTEMISYKINIENQIKQSTSDYINVENEIVGTNYNIFISKDKK